MEIISPMDIDPCVVSRSECAARTYDLTPSEHAGVNLSDPLPMVFTTSNSPAHSETTTQPTVEDVVVTDMQAETDSFIFCVPCEVTCTSEHAYKRHKEGKTHLQNTQMLVVSSTSNSPAHSEVSAQPSDVVVTHIQTASTPSIVCDGYKEGKTQLKSAQTLLVSSEPKQETESPIANVTLDQHPGNKKNQDPLQKEALAVVDSLFVCSIPDPGCDYQKIVTEDQMTTPMCMDQPSMTKTNGGAQNGYDKLNVNQLLWCNICKISCSSEKCFERHMLGKQHLKVLKQSEKIEAFHASQTSMDMTPIEMSLENLKPVKCQPVNMDGDNKPTWCEVCEVSCTSTNDFNKHSSGKKHLKNLQKLGKVPELASTPSPLVNMTSANPKEGNLTRCELCGILCSSSEELTKHLLGQKHKKIVRNSQTLTRYSLAPAAAKTSLEDLMYEDMEEGVIVAEDKSKRKANGSLASYDNVDTKRQKVAEKVMDSGGGKNSQILKRHSLAPAAAKTSLEDLMYEDMEEGKIVAEDRSKRKANGSLASDDNVDTKRQKVAEKVMDSGELLTCRLCNVASNGFMAYQDHLLSSEHSAMVIKQINGRSTNSKKPAKKVTVYVRKNKQTDITSENVISNKENVIDVDVANAPKAKTLICVSCMQNVLIPCHDNCFANYKLNVRSNVRRPLSTKSRTPKSYDTTYVVRKTRFSKESTLSKSLDTTYVISKPKIDVESTSKANDKIVDSGCSKHMTSDRSLLKNFIKKFMGTVRFGNDNVAAITGYGDYIQGNITICHVYYVEGLGHNLFSVGQFCDGDLEVAFRSKTCYVRHLEGDDLLTSDRESNLYTIFISDMAASSPVCLMSKATSTKSWLWHRRLSHLNFGTINDLTRLDLVDGLPKFKYGKDHLCSACERGKSKKASHPLKLVPSDHSKLELLHMDLCGPMRVASINGKKYILVIVDDYSRYTWVYFLHSKDETPEIIKNHAFFSSITTSSKLSKKHKITSTVFLMLSPHSFNLYTQSTYLLLLPTSHLS
ncbi:integrase, catalytic region, zinc finger, CCHC-type containing protein [Tanacetum coccineum]